MSSGGKVFLLQPLNPSSAKSSAKAKYLSSRIPQHYRVEPAAAGGGRDSGEASEKSTTVNKFKSAKMFLFIYLLFLFSLLSLLLFLSNCGWKCMTPAYTRYIRSTSRSYSRAFRSKLFSIAHGTPTVNHLKSLHNSFWLRLLPACEVSFSFSSTASSLFMNQCLSLEWLPRHSAQLVWTRCELPTSSAYTTINADNVRGIKGRPGRE
jgi:hypothetical protein